ncbi:MAG: prepilin-type N-terminal cleavage/methylation domain-containing protein [Deltaproteobacteria bacterium]|nr:prepilin-type N-terminal cleavage/methylation domain-containing protein [Deltaproteobacteria bacterium]
MRRIEGFTLIELMVVVAIIAVVSALVVPSFSVALQRERQRQVSNFIIKGVFSARSRAARTGRCHRMTVTLDAPVVGGGSGGEVLVEEYLGDPTKVRRRTLNCNATEGALPAEWNVVNRFRVSSVGPDVALSQCVADVGGEINSPNAVVLRFEPTGEPFIGDVDRRFFHVAAFDAAGTGVGVDQQVRISEGGSVLVTIKRD